MENGDNENYKFGKKGYSFAVLMIKKFKKKGTENVRIIMISHNRLRNTPSL